jgi:lysozyme family protein
MRETLPVALQLTFGDEGGYSNVATDSGGPTKYGITYKTLAAHDGISQAAAREAVKHITLEKATEIYRAGYWTQSGGDLLPKGLDYVLFNCGVMSGPSRAVKILQRLVGAVEDGNIGVQTVAAVDAYPGGLRKLIVAYCDAYMDFLKAIKGKQGFASNGRGWTIRITGKDPKGQWADKPGVVGNALRLATDATVYAPKAPDAAPVPAGGDAKAVPPAPNPLAKPEVLLPGAAAVITAAAPLATGPVVWAIAFAVVVLVLLGAFYAFRRIARTQA